MQKLLDVLLCFTITQIIDSYAFYHVCLSFFVSLECLFRKICICLYALGFQFVFIFSYLILSKQGYSRSNKNRLNAKIYPSSKLTFFSKKKKIIKSINMQGDWTRFPKLKDTGQLLIHVYIYLYIYINNL